MQNEKLKDIRIKNKYNLLKINIDQRKEIEYLIKKICEECRIMENSIFSRKMKRNPQSIVKARSIFCYIVFYRINLPVNIIQKFLEIKQNMVYYYLKISMNKYYNYIKDFQKKYYNTELVT